MAVPLLASFIDDLAAVEARAPNDVLRDALGVREIVRVVPVGPGAIFVLVLRVDLHGVLLYLRFCGLVIAFVSLHPQGDIA